MIEAWKLVGFGGQAMFFSRFFVQWVVSERTGRSTVPTAFWWLSLAGGFLLLLYAAIGIQDIVFSVGQGMGLFVYLRNLILVRRQRLAETAPAPEQTRATQRTK
ncbi:MAG: lipid-A-disaccharide synthase N-terminal domain-containing protein [Acidobacteriota bacterium]|nr:MAG: lipid-A-disaccharide synthase N-terminal domain-containing protein [Acidobacteriota bacterium]